MSIIFLKLNLNIRHFGYLLEFFIVLLKVVGFFLVLGHNNHIRCITHSPIGAAFVSCSDDFRARFWYCEGV